MRINEAINEIRKEKKWSLQQLAVAIGKKRGNDVSARLATANMSFDKAIEMLSVMGYEVVVQPITTGNRKAGAIVIDGSDVKEEAKNDG